MTDNNIYTENSIRTFTGKVFDLKILDPESICIEDIAHSLSLTPRFGGHLEKMYSVAQHSVMVSINCIENQLAGLLHDASEAYIGDMPSPFKRMMPEYKIIENRLMEVIAKKYGFSIPLPAEVKAADRMLLDMEWEAFVNKGFNMEYWTPEEAENEFLRMFHSLTD
ncbi:YfbR-like 5'-deoxynucleotidase [Christiangramia sp.]|uniref:YfbR-like 5'-deoxynucleotidase n=1 Tax=Christiangramia sp. TaxID=1931228 RepID=UPI00262790E4|nr:YfbR-like 5'-deoxynucleotidase [Christiangramia sp.]